MRLRIIIASLLYIVFFFVGCQTVKDAYDAYIVCHSNAVCSAEMKKGADLASALAVSVATAVPVPGVQASSVAIGTGAGMLASILIGVFRGRRFKRSD